MHVDQYSLRLGIFIISIHRGLLLLCFFVDEPILPFPPQQKNNDHIFPIVCIPYSFYVK